MMDAAEIYSLFEARRKDLGLTQAEVSMRAFRKADNTALQNIKKGSSPSVDRVAALATALGLDFYLGPKRETAPVPLVTLDATDYASIPLHEAWLSAGPGSENSGANIIDHLAFRRDWLARIGISASQSCLARVSGDSMFPTLSPGDMVLIDTSKTDPQIRSRAPQDKRRPMIWALLDSGEARIKRIERPNSGTILLISDNPDHPPELRTGHQLDQLKVIGKVVWWGHTAST
jgi:SOS-response transcriptional repressor LexA